jgi:hypothetical protein
MPLDISHHFSVVRRPLADQMRTARGQEAGRLDAALHVNATPPPSWEAVGPMASMRAGKVACMISLLQPDDLASLILRTGLHDEAAGAVR